MLKGIIPIMRPNILFAELNLISDAFALAGELGLSGIDGDGVRIVLHSLPPCNINVMCISLLYHIVAESKYAGNDSEKALHRKIGQYGSAMNESDARNV